MTATAPKRTPLTRARVAEGALALVDREGLSSLSMRKLGAEVGVEAMSLYNHVRNKDDLYNELSEVLHQQILAAYRATPAADWRERATAMAYAYFDVAFAHPHAFPVIASHPVASPAGIAVLAECVQIFVDAGLDLEHASLAFHTAGAWLVGSIGQELTLMQRLAEGQGFTADDVPDGLGFLPEFKAHCLCLTERDRFQAGLEIMLAGTAAYVERVRYDRG